MEIILKNTIKTLTESGQINPLRWMCLHQIGEETFQNTSPLFKCKDYFNDFVAHKYINADFTIYGMRADSVKFDPYGGLSVLVCGITPYLEGNIQRVLEPVFGKLWDAHVHMRILSPHELKGETEYLTGDTAILWFSPQCFVSTFRISAITLFIRECNVPFLVEDFDSRCDRQLVQRAGWNPNIWNMFRKREICFPEQKENWFFFGHGSDRQNPMWAGVGSLHDNGVNSWCNYVLPIYKGDPWKWYTTLPVLNAAPATESSQEEEDEDGEEEQEFN